MRQTNRRTMREPRETERIWNNCNVDKNLENAWLETLNSLQLFNLISICEGHVEGRGPFSSRPHINLRIKEQYLPLMAREFDDISNDWQRKLTELFSTDETLAEIEYKLKFNSSRSRQEITRDLTIHISSRVTRQTVKINQNTIKWFEEMVGAISKFDVFTYKMFSD